MATKWLSVVARVLVATACAAPACAEGIGDFFSSINRDIKRRNCWPVPFVYGDRQAAREPIALMVCNGWERQNMLADVHFEAGGTRLTEAGRLKVLSILNDTAEQHRMVYVHRAANVQETSVRIRTAQLFVAQSAYGGQLAPVLETNRSDYGSPAERVDLINRKALAASPDPKLPQAGGSGSSSGGGGGSGGH
jgi:hypothetical protein